MKKRTYGSRFGLYVWLESRAVADAEAAARSLSRAEGAPSPEFAESALRVARWYADSAMLLHEWAYSALVRTVEVVDASGGAA